MSLGAAQVRATREARQEGEAAKREMARATEAKGFAATMASRVAGAPTPPTLRALSLAIARQRGLPLGDAQLAARRILASGAPIGETREVRGVQLSGAAPGVHLMRRSLTSFGESTPVSVRDLAKKISRARGCDLGIAQVLATRAASRVRRGGGGTGGFGGATP